MQIAFRHLENCLSAQKWVSVFIYDVRTSSVIRYLRGFQLCTTELNNVCACAETGEVWDLT